MAGAAPAEAAGAPSPVLEGGEDRGEEQAAPPTLAHAEVAGAPLVSAETAAGVVTMLRNDDAARALAAAKLASNMLESAAARESAATCDALIATLVDAGAVPALLALLKSTAPRATLAWPLHALALLTRQASGREAVRLAEGVPCLLDTLGDSAHVLRNCMSDPSFREAVVADNEFVRRVAGALRTAAFAAEINPTTVVALVRCCSYMGSHSPEPRAALWDAGVVLPLVALLKNHKATTDVCNKIFGFVTWLQHIDGPGRENHVALYDAGVYTAVVATMQSSRTVLCTAAANVLHRAYAANALVPALRTLLLRTPGALVSVALAAAADTSTPNHARFLLRLMQQDNDLGNAHASWLLDADYAALAVMELRGKDDGLVNAFMARWTGAADHCIRILAQPLPYDELPALVSNALLAAACTPRAARFRELLASGTRLELLLGNYTVYAGFVCPADCIHASRRQWHRRAIRGAVRAIAGVVSMSAAAGAAHEADAAEPAAKRARTASASLRAEDVNVKRRDSTVFVIGGEPFYVNGELIEAASPLLRDALHAAESLDPIPLPAPHGVPAEHHYALFRAAVEHAYTGCIADIAASQLLPLWCLADHLQMASLRAWCAARLRPLLAANAELLESAWESALSRSCDALCLACARAWLEVLAAEPAEPPSPDANLELLARLEPSCAQGTTTPSQYVVRALRAALQPPAAAAAAS